MAGSPNAATSIIQTNNAVMARNVTVATREGVTKECMHTPQVIAFGGIREEDVHGFGRVVD
jgi:hypothetical protein